MFSYSLIERYEGNYIDNVDARTAAMGGAATAGGVSLLDAVVNPANITALDNTAGLQIGFGLMKSDDSRRYPMYNFFDGYIEDATYASNVDYYGEFSGGIHYNYAVEDFTLAAALIYRPWSSFDCDYEEQVRNDYGSDSDTYPEIVAQNFIDSDGMINAASINLGVRYLDKYALAFEIVRLNGTQEMDRRLVWSEYANQQNNDLTDEIISYERDFETISFTVGMLAEINERFTFGASFTPEITFDDEAEVTIESLVDTTIVDEYYLANVRDVVYPSKIRGGISYTPKNPFRTIVNLDVEVVNWGDVNDLFETELNYYLGIEHKINRKMPLRLGFKYLTNYNLITNDEFVYSKKMSYPVFTAGTGIEIREELQLDISIEYANRSYDSLDLFMDGNYNQPGLWDSIVPQDRGWENPDTVEQSMMKIQTSLTYRW